MLNSQDLQFFAVIATSTSLAAAARTLDVSPPAVSQRLQQLEKRLGVRLVDRSSNRLHLTAEGEVLSGRGAEVLHEIEGIAVTLAERQGAVIGPLRVAASFGFGRAYVTAAMATMRRKYPQVDLTLTLFDHPMGSVRTDNWDVLIHVGALVDSSLTLRRLAPNRRILCAAPSYLENQGIPMHPEDLRRHVCGVVREDQAEVCRWSFNEGSKTATTVRVRPSLTSNDGEIIKRWALAGLCIVQRSEWDVADDLRAGRLVELLPGWLLADADVVALLGPRAGRAVRIDRFVAILKEALTPVPWKVDTKVTAGLT